MHYLAQRLLALEAGSRSATDANKHEALRVCEKLRNSLIRFAGADSFTALLRRALTLARLDVASLQSVNVTADGGLAGLEEIGSAAENVAPEAAIAITAHLLGLLATFIGESLTLRLLREAWPEASLDEDF